MSQRTIMELNHDFGHRINDDPGGLVSLIMEVIRGDLFHEDVPDDWIDRVFAVMALAPQHTFQVLTKRADRMRAYMIGERYSVVDAAVEITSNARGNIAGIVQRENMDKRGDWPLPNVWLGVSAEDQPRADERIPHLLATPAAVRFVSVEPMLGPVDLEPYVSSAWSTDHHEWPKLGNLDWVIVGGESGPGARPMHPHWARGLRDQCVAAAVPFFFRQWGAWICAGQQDETRLRTPPSGDEIKWLREDGLVSVRPISALTPGGLDDSDGETKIVGGEEVTVFPDHNWLPVSCVGKARAGNLLDGKLWQQFPATLEDRA